MALYSCISCRVSFTSSSVQRLHYRSDWHRYNLKRKVAELPPVTQEAFDEKLARQRDEQEECKDSSQICNVCKKSFSNQNAYVNHVKSKKHKLLESKKGSNTIKGHCSTNYVKAKDEDNVNSGSDEWEDIEEEEIDEESNEDSEAIPSTSCLFCHHESVSFEDNLRHMTKSHSFFIPDIDYVTELERFIIYLGSKVGDGKLCLYCNEKSRIFPSVEAVQKHMKDKGHSMLDYEGDSALEYADFYDFSSSYPDCELRQANDEDEVPDSVQGSIEIDEATLELILPSGGRAGHRSLKHIYKQSLPPAHLQNRRERAMIRNLNSEYKSLGWHGALTIATKKQMIDHKMKRRAIESENLKLGLKANKFQPHFRAQIRC